MYWATEIPTHTARTIRRKTQGDPWRSLLPSGWISSGTQAKRHGQWPLITAAGLCGSLISWLHLVACYIGQYPNLEPLTRSNELDSQQQMISSWTDGRHDNERFLRISSPDPDSVHITGCWHGLVMIGSGYSNRSSLVLSTTLVGSRGSIPMICWLSMPRVPTRFFVNILFIWLYHIPGHIPPLDTVGASVMTTMWPAGSPYCVPMLVVWSYPSPCFFSIPSVSPSSWDRSKQMVPKIEVTPVLIPMFHHW